MKKFIAYFDYLGYKDFIFNNDSNHLKTRASHILRDIEMALGQGKYKDSNTPGVTISDLSTSRINCLNISDTVIFWTIDDSIESLEELLIVSHRFNWQEILFNMPVRGVIYFDEFEMISGTQTNTVGAVYSANLIYGKGLVKAHLKAESLNWAGTVIDQSVINYLEGKIDIPKFLEPYAKFYAVPYKGTEPTKHEYAFKIIAGSLNEIAFGNEKKNIIRSFSSDNKSVDSARVQELQKNTITFLETFKE